MKSIGQKIVERLKRFTEALVRVRFRTAYKPSITLVTDGAEEPQRTFPEDFARNAALIHDSKLTSATFTRDILGKTKS